MSCLDSSSFTLNHSILNQDRVGWAKATCSFVSGPDRVQRLLRSPLVHTVHTSDSQSAWELLPALDPHLWSSLVFFLVCCVTLHSEDPILLVSDHFSKLSGSFWIILLYSRVPVNVLCWVRSTGTMPTLHVNTFSWWKLQHILNYYGCSII